jgi:hypothetical protein
MVSAGGTISKKLDASNALPITGCAPDGSFPID